MTDLIEWVHHDLEPIEPLLVVSMGGWIDAGGAAATAVEYLLEASSAARVASFDAERLIDHRARRPTMHLVDGVNEGLEWPSIDLSFGVDDDGRHLFILHGAEPDHYWRTFVELVVGMAEAHQVRKVIGFGGYPAAVPHIRPVGLSATASTRELAHDPAFMNTTLDVPAGIQAAIETEAAAAGIPAMGIWAQVPHYGAGLPYPAASVALLEALDRFADIHVDLTALEEEGESARAHLDELVADNPEHITMVRQLEAEYDETARGQAELPTGDEIADELQRYLREQDDP